MRRMPGLLLLLGLVCGGTWAADATVPPALQDWQAWVLHGQEQRTCPLLSTSQPGNPASYQCAWPGRLRLVMGKDGGQFQLDVHVDAESWIDLPGSRDAWPQQVQLDGAPATVLDRNGTPALRLAAGDYVVRGVFEWDERPARLEVPAAIALVDLSVDGVAIAQPERDGGNLTLGAASSRQREADALSLRVFRRLADGAPPMLATRIDLHVAGSAREQVLGPALPDGFIATSLDGDLPARLDPDGRLRVQLRPGNWSLALDARGTAPLESLPFHASPTPWPRQETWSYADAPALRTTGASGPPPVDPAQAGVPEDWRGLSAFAMQNGATLKIQQRARGLSADAGGHLKLDRQLWLDFNGKGLTANDHLSGAWSGAARLDVAAPWTLERASGGNDVPLLVTRGASDNLSGVEVRARALDLGAGVRRDTHGGAQSATGGWQHTLDGVTATLHLPWGYRLLGAPGADYSPDSWVARWNLLDLFIAAVIALLTWRLLGWRWALAALGFVVLSHGEPCATRWTAGLAVALALVARALPAGKLRAAARYSGIAMLALAVLATLWFGTWQIRDALYPQLESAPSVAGMVRTEFIPPPPGAGAARTDRMLVKERAMAAPKATPLPPPPQESTLQSMVVTGAAASAGNQAGAQAYPPGTVVQSGRGIPDWGDIGSSYRLGWSGPVTPDQTWRLVILPSWATRILRVVMLLLLLAWLAGIARRLGVSPGTRRRPPSVAAGAAVLLFALASPHAQAQATPSPELLAQLQARLLEAPACVPQCAASPSAQVSVAGNAVTVAIEANVGARVAFPLPRIDEPATLAAVTLDGKPATMLVRRDGEAWIALERGAHRVGMTFTVGSDAETATLHFPLPPPRLLLSAPGWQASGLDGSRLLSDTLVLSRLRVAASGNGAEVAAQAFPPYVRLTRNVQLGIDSRVENRIERIAPAQGGFSVALPLLPGEHVTTPGLTVEHGKVTVSFAAGQDQANWSSTLDTPATLALHAPVLGERAEVWTVGSSPLLHLAFSGVPASTPDTGADDGAHVFRPLPGETLDVQVTRPTALPGHTTAFDRVGLAAVQGDRALESTLTLAVRSTRGGEHVIDLPREARLLEATRDGQPLELNPRDGHVGLPLQPGGQRFQLSFRQAEPLGVDAATPALALHAPAANIDVSLALPHDRWTLWAWGPAAGPAVLVWPELIALLVVAVMLARFAPTPLRWWHWLLLGLGFSTFAWFAFALVALWLIVVGLRDRGSGCVQAWRPTLFNLAQVALGLLTLVALVCLVAAVPQGLLGQPDMRIQGHGSTAAMLRWFADQSDNAVPRAGAFSLPLWTYKVAMLAWALWLANALIGWLRWGFRAWTRGGYWKSAPRAPVAPPPANAPNA